MLAWAVRVHQPFSMITKQPPFTMDAARVATSPIEESNPSPQFVGDGEAGAAGGGGPWRPQPAPAPARRHPGDITYDII